MIFLLIMTPWSVDSFKDYYENINSLLENSVSFSFPHLCPIPSLKEFFFSQTDLVILFSSASMSLHMYA